MWKVRTLPAHSFAADSSISLIVGCCPASVLRSVMLAWEVAVACRHSSRLLIPQHASPFSAMHSWLRHARSFSSYRAVQTPGMGAFVIAAGVTYQCGSREWAPAMLKRCGHDGGGGGGQPAIVAQRACHGNDQLGRFDDIRIYIRNLSCDGREEPGVGGQLSTGCQGMHWATAASSGRMQLHLQMGGWER